MQNIKSKKTKRILLNILLGYMIIQPLFDIYWLYKDEVINIFKFSPATIIRMAIMCVLFLFAFLWWKNKNKYKYFIGFSSIFIIYSIFHHINSLAFSVPYGNFDNYSTIKELFYVIRMIMPLLMIFVTYEFKITPKRLKTIVVWVAFIFSSIMIISNFFEFALSSYGDVSSNVVVNFFKWFNKDTYVNYTYLEVASKGIFHMANQVSGVLVMLLPILLVIFFKKSNFINGLVISMTILAMMMLGTRVASLGWLAILLAMVIFYLFFCFVKKSIKFNIKSLIFIILNIICFSIILPYSPVMNRTYIQDNTEMIEDGLEDNNINEEVSKFKEAIAKKEAAAKTEEEFEEIKKEKIAVIEKYKDFYGFDAEYIDKIYNYEEDSDFWLDMMDIPFEERADHRQLKQLITKRIISLNNNYKDYIIGMSFTRLRNAPCYMENDIYVHMYSIGIVGILIFICPYLVILLYGIFKVFTKYKEKFTFFNISLLFSIALTFLAGMLSGNVFDEWICTLFLGLICGSLLYNLNREKKTIK